jgi:hypothetical protein
MEEGEERPKAEEGEAKEAKEVWREEKGEISKEAPKKADGKSVEEAAMIERLGDQDRPWSAEEERSHGE